VRVAETADSLLAAPVFGLDELGIQAAALAFAAVVVGEAILTPPDERARQLRNGRFKRHLSSAPARQDPT
jgi:hypothetical protein